MSKSNDTLVSVIIPTYKRSESLVRAIKSVITQTYKNIEIIVVDDNASFPEIRENNKKTIQNYPELIFVENETNLGGGLSRNEGIKVAKGKMIAFLDDDDEYFPSKIEKQMRLYNSIDKTNVALIYCYAEMINVDGSSYIYKNDLEGCPLIENIEHCVAPTSFWLCERELLLNVGGFEKISSRQDASLITKLLINNYEIYRVPEVLLKYYWHNSANGISKNNINSVNAEKQYREMFLKLARDSNLSKNIVAEGDYQFLYRLAREYVVIGMWKEALKVLSRMNRYHLVGKKNIRIFLTAVFNKMYKVLYLKKNKKRVG